jgi:hypothetical protein
MILFRTRVDKNEAANLPEPTPKQNDCHCRVTLAEDASYAPDVRSIECIQPLKAETRRRVNPEVTRSLYLVHPYVRQCSWKVQGNARSPVRNKGHGSIMGGT